ncbi:MAG TPA: FG-GAP repeat protein, partial [Blastocatellia bacterium]
MRVRFIYFAGSLLFVGLLVSEFALSSSAAKAILQPRASANTALQPLPTLRGTEAVERLKEEGLYSSLAEAVAAADPLIVQQAKLTANDGVDGDAFGGSVAISGDTAVIGASNASLNAPAQGSVHVFVRSGRSWTRQARLTAPGAAASDHFGASVAISGDTLVAGAPDDDIDTNMEQGSAHVFGRSGGTWIHLQRITLNDGGANYRFGASVAIDADTVVIGTPGVEGNKGLVYVFALDGGIWIERQKLAAPDGAASDRFGA